MNNAHEEVYKCGCFYVVKDPFDNVRLALDECEHLNMARQSELGSHASKWEMYLHRFFGEIRCIYFRKLRCEYILQLHDFWVSV